MIKVLHLDWVREGELLNRYDSLSASEATELNFIASAKRVDKPSKESVLEYDDIASILIESGRFSEVASVETDNLEDAFRLTNSIDCFWGDNEEVEMVPTEAGGYRSTSVGDIMIKEVDGRSSYFAVSSFGFKEFENVL